MLWLCMCVCIGERRKEERKTKIFYLQKRIDNVRLFVIVVVMLFSSSKLMIIMMMIMANRIYSEYRIFFFERGFFETNKVIPNVIVKRFILFLECKTPKQAKDCHHHHHHHQWWWITTILQWTTRETKKNKTKLQEIMNKVLYDVIDEYYYLPCYLSISLSFICKSSSVFFFFSPIHIVIICDFYSVKKGRCCLPPPQRICFVLCIQCVKRLTPSRLTTNFFFP